MAVPFFYALREVCFYGLGDDFAGVFLIHPFCCCFPDARGPLSIIEFTNRLACNEANTAICPLAKMGCSVQIPGELRRTSWSRVKSLGKLASGGCVLNRKKRLPLDNKNGIL